MHKASQEREATKLASERSLILNVLLTSAGMVSANEEYLLDVQAVAHHLVKLGLTTCSKQVFLLS